MDKHNESSESTVQGVTVRGKVGNYTYVDLGLPSGTLWATYNVGATKPEEYGDHFAWGETEPKEASNWITYKWCTVDANGKLDKFTKYSDIYYGENDGKNVLESEDDAATANWGCEWRMPRAYEMKELIDNCSWEWTDDFKGKGIAGWAGFSHTNGAMIFFPAGRYWSSMLWIRPNLVEGLLFDEGSIYKTTHSRLYCLSVRAVVK